MQIILSRNCVVVAQSPKGGFSKGSFCRVQCHGQGNKKHPRIVAPAVHLALLNFSKVSYIQGAAKGGVIKGGVYKSKRTQKNARKRRQTQMSDCLIRVVETVVLENSVLDPCRNKVVLTKISKNSDTTFDPRKQRILLLRPRKSTKMADVTQAE